MISFRMMSLPVFALAASLMACTAEQSTTAKPDTASTAQQAAQGDGPEGGPEGRGHGPRGHHGPGGPGGPELLIHASLRAPIDLTAAQRTTIEGLLKRPDGPPDHAAPPPFDAKKAQDLAAAIRAGDVSALPKPPPPDQAKMQAHLAESAAKMKTLHDTLGADQRAKLVADIESHAPKAGEKPGDKGGKPGPELRGGPHGPHGPHGGPDMFAHDLNLTDAQKEQLEAKFEANHPKPDLEAMRAEMKTKLESFKADSFDATAFVTPPAHLQPKPDGNPLADLVSVLTPEQREILAKKIEAGPPPGGPRGPQH